MITALQNFISSRGKFVFVLLLVVVVVAFVLYLAQGASVFDLLPDPNQEKKEFYGADLNDPDQMRALNFQNRVASDFGAVIPPLEDSIETADKMFAESMQAQLQAAFQSGRENVNQAELQRLFSFIQSWPNFPKNLKVREIARAGFYEPIFSQASIKAMLVMAAQANAWGYLFESDKHIGINDGFNRYVRELDPSLFNSDENRSRVLQFVAARQGVRVQFVESSLFTHFRANQVDRIYTDGAYTLDKEGELDLFSNQFAWKADILSVKSSSLEDKIQTPSLFSISFNKQPDDKDKLELLYGSLNRTITFVEKISDQNTTDVQIPIGSNISETLSNLVGAFEDSDFVLKIGGKDRISMIPDLDNLPSIYPSVKSVGDSIEVANELNEQLKTFHSEHKSDPEFIEPSRTFATMVTFPTSNFLSIPPEPSDSRIKSYFDLNRAQFESVPEVPEPSESTDGEKGPVGESDSNVSTSELNLIDISLSDANSTNKKEVQIEDVRDEIRLIIIEEDRLDAERDAKDLAREASLRFLDELNALGDKLRSKYSKYSQKRNSEEIKNLIVQSGGVERKISFGDKDKGVQAAILGIERRESERRSNREPLDEVSNLNESLFFTRSIRTIRDGFAVFVLDRKTEEKPGEFSKAPFAQLFKGYFDGIRLSAFNNRVDEIFVKLEANDNNQSFRNYGQHLAIDGKSLSGIQSTYRIQNQRLQARVGKLETERNRISAAERDNNASAEQVARKKELDALIENLREEQDEVNSNRSLATQLVEACPNLDVGAGWTELEKTDKEAVFVRLNAVYSMKSKKSSNEEVSERVSDLELARGEKNRDLILAALIEKELSKSAKD